MKVRRKREVVKSDWLTTSDREVMKKNNIKEKELRKVQKRRIPLEGLSALRSRKQGIIIPRKVRLAGRASQKRQLAKEIGDV